MNLPLSTVTTPSGWAWAPFGRVAQRSRAADRPDLDPLSVFLDAGVVPRASRDDNFNRLGGDMSKYLWVRPGDLVFNKLRTWQGGLGLSSHEGIVSPAYYVCRPDQTQAHGGYLHYLLRSRVFLSELTRISKSMPPSQFDILWDDLARMPVLVPPLDEQRRIADFLDTETARIDALIEAKKGLIERLAERRLAEIDAAVTSGVERGVGVRTVGLPSLPTVPSHWSTAPLKRFVGFREGPGIMASSFRDEGVPLLRIGNLRNGTVELAGCNFLDPAEVSQRWHRFGVVPGELLVSASATTSEPVFVPEDVSGAIPYTGIIRLWTASTDLRIGYLRWFLASWCFTRQVDSVKTGVGITHWGPTHLSKVVMPIPSVSEQDSISAHLDQVVSTLGGAVDLIKTQISHLREYRQALVAAAVTGQLDEATLNDSRPVDDDIPLEVSV